MGEEKANTEEGEEVGVQEGRIALSFILYK